MDGLILNNFKGVIMKQTQERFNYLMETLDEQRMSILLDDLTPEEREATNAIIADLEAELEEYGLNISSS